MSNRHLMIDLLRAVQIKDSETIREMLLNNPGFLDNPDLGDFKGVINSPFSKALVKGNKEIILLFIELGGIDINDVYIQGTVKLTPLQFLAVGCEWPNTIEVAEFLINRGAKVNTKISGQFPILVIALMAESNLELIEFWLKNGAAVNGPTYDNWITPAKYAFEYQDLFIRKEILLLLLKHGLDVRFKGEFGENLLHILCDSENVSGDIRELAAILINAGVPIDELDHDDFSPLHYAVDRHDPPLVSYFINQGADVSGKSKSEGLFPLIMAVGHGNDYLTGLLLSCGADVNARTHFGDTALHAACYEHNPQIISRLMCSGAEVSPENNQGSTPLSFLLIEDPIDEASTIIILKKLSKMYFDNQPVSEKDIDLIYSNPVAQKQFELCLEELSRMKKTKFHLSFSYYSVLNMSKNIKKLANLTKNKEFVFRFYKSLSFSLFNSDLQQILYRAFYVRDRSLCVDFRLLSVFGNVFSDVIIRNFAKYTTVEDLLLM